MDSSTFFLLWRFRFFGLRGSIPDVLSIVLANMLVYTGTVLSYVGSRRFFGKPPRVLPWAALGGLLLIMMVWWSYFAPSFTQRLLFASASLVLVFAFHIALYLRQERLSFSGRFMLVAMSVQIFALLGRMLSVGAGAAGSGLLEPSFWQNLYIATYSFTTLSLSIGAILMATDAVRAEFQHLLAHDALTGALSRTALVQASERELERCRRHGRTMALLLIDLDHFKTINDTYGHQTGDQVLVDFVQRTQNQLRAHDHIGRYGGEEFLVLLPETTLKTAIVVAERIRADVAAPRAGMPAYTISTGIAWSEEVRANDTVDTLIARADKSMYNAKASGRNRTAWEALL